MEIKIFVKVNAVQNGRSGSSGQSGGELSICFGLGKCLGVITASFLSGFLFIDFSYSI